MCEFYAMKNIVKSCLNSWKYEIMVEFINLIPDSASNLFQ